MTKHITDSEKLTQMALNRKYIEIEKRDKRIAELEKIIEGLNIQIHEQKNTISQLCSQLSRLFLKSRNDVKQ